MKNKLSSSDKIIDFLIDLKTKKEKNISKLKFLKKQFARDLTKIKQEG